MEEAKREKEERKVINAQSGKNVDIDFELMIEKNKFKEKLLTPHTSSNDLKVISILPSLQSVSAKDPSSRNRNKEAKSILFLAPTLKSKCMSLSTRSMESRSMFKIMSSPLIILLTKRRYSLC